MNDPHVKYRWVTCVILLVLSMILPGNVSGQTGKRAIEFPDIPGYKTLICDLHMHTVLSDGSVWPDIRVREAIRDGLDAISITDHLEYQPHSEDIPHPDRNRGYNLALESAGNSGLIIINGAEITRSMPPGHFNAIFLEDANKLLRDDILEVFREARRQDAFVCWNHPHWTAQQPDGVATLQEIHEELINGELINGIEVYNENTYSDEALRIALDKGLTILGTSDIHGLIDWMFDVPGGGHRPVTLAFASEKSPESLKEALFKGRTAVWFDNTLVGSAEFLVPLIEGSLQVESPDNKLVRNVFVFNVSDASYILENLSGFTFHNHSHVVALKAHERTLIQVKTAGSAGPLSLRFRVLNTVTAPGQHAEIEIRVE